MGLNAHLFGFLVKIWKVVAPRSLARSKARATEPSAETCRPTIGSGIWNQKKRSVGL